MRSMFRCLLVVSALGLLSTDAAAAPILWTLNGVTISGGGGGTVTGSFVFDADTGVYSNLAITSTLPNASFDTSDVGGPFGSFATRVHMVANFGLADLSFQPSLVLDFSPALTNAGGSVSVGGLSGRCDDAACASIFVTGNIFAGSAASVPEPASLLLLGAGLLGGIARFTGGVSVHARSSAPDRP